MPAQEAAPTAAERRAARQSNQTAFNLVLALLASLGIVALLVTVVVRPDVPPRTVDYRSAADAAAGAFPVPIILPDLSEEWSANRAVVTLEPADGVPRWDIGFLTPGGAYVELTQGVEANLTWISEQVSGALPVDVVRIGGLAWDRYDRRDLEDPGNVAAALVTVVGDSTLVVSGTASDAELEQIATAVAEAAR